jgi:(E)-4-hydroxy-3-methylbut-2-enyl-diphosphate synthase
MQKVQIGNIILGGDNNVVVQTMTNVDTNNISKTVSQCIDLFNAGAELVRITAQTEKEAENLKIIKLKLVQKGFSQGIIADIHFKPKAAIIASKYVEKIRINPGNYTIQNDDKDLDHRLKPLIESCKTNKTAIRIGSNFGSLSKKILEKYGNTPLGMVESAQEFIEVCVNNNFFNIVISMKAGNARIMVKACRILQDSMIENNLIFPQHLGVTEAGNGIEARIKSSIGIATLLSEGIGDTIRVSLTENPVNEIPVAKKIVKLFSYKRKKEIVHLNKTVRTNSLILNKYIVISDSSLEIENSLCADFIFIENIENHEINDRNYICDYNNWEDKNNVFPIFSVNEYLNKNKKSKTYNFIKCTISELTDNFINIIKNDKTSAIILNTDNYKDIFELRNNYNKVISKLKSINIILQRNFNNTGDDFIIKSSGELGSILIDKLADGLWITNKNVSSKQILELSFGVLQATKLRITKTEFISCPACGRTKFDIESITNEVKSKTSHLIGLKIAVMGCVVNGPGEMADADYGYVGSTINKIHLYKDGKIIKKNIPQENALTELISIIKANGDWINPK